MSQRIQLAAIVARDGLLYFRRPKAGGPWELPCGPLPDGHDVDAAMDEVLAQHGVNAPAIEEDFVRTSYLGPAGAGIVLNLYAPTEWRGEPEAPDGFEGAWFGLAEVEDLDMDDEVRSAVLEAFGIGEVPDSDMEILAAMNEGLPAVGTPHQHAPQFQSRRDAGLDVLGTLNRMPGERAARQMRAMYGELTDDVLEFALGSVWASPALDRKTKSLQVVAMIAAQGGGAAGPLRSHINGALNHGATAEELVETMRLVAVYAGFPAALEGWRVMEKVLAGRGHKLTGDER